MSEFTQHKENRVQAIMVMAKALLKQEKVNPLYKKFAPEIEKLIPSDVITAIDRIMVQEKDLPEVKIMVNKLLNLIYKPINEYPQLFPEKNTFLWYLAENNSKAASLLKNAGNLLKSLNKETDKSKLILELKNQYQDLLNFEKLYTIKENILFPVLEKYWSDYRCTQLMWSYQDDIRRDIKEMMDLLLPYQELNMARINRLAGDISFRIMAIKFRDEKILFPHILDTIQEKVLNDMLISSSDLEYPYVKPSGHHKKTEASSEDDNTTKVDLGTGAILPEQIKLIFNHLPVDITYVDENNKVLYYSTPKHRIFPRTKAVIGRDVHNCHPPESVHVVEKIVEAFRNGSRDKASFWIHMKDQFVLIQYFAVRDEKGVFRGTLEVSQEISEINSLEGNQRLLDWE